MKLVIPSDSYYCVANWAVPIRLLGSLPEHSFWNSRVSGDGTRYNKCSFDLRSFICRYFLQHIAASLHSSTHKAC